ncbi:MAG: serine/threonine-protein kinase, partial [Planctomycetota bacterium]|nr:serine/threonine-protein kinase [Planctomycetota bacterium]
MNAPRKLAQAKWLASHNYASPDVLQNLLNSAEDRDLFFEIGAVNHWTENQVEECRWAFQLTAPSLTAQHLRHLLHSTDVVSHAQFHDYVILQEISRGGMGIVFRAIHIESRAQVALKLLLDDNPSERSQAFFEREALALARLSHPNIVQIKTYGHHLGIPFIVMEHVDGRTLEDFVEDHIRSEGTISISLVVDIFEKLARALDYTHEMGLIHRDLKPQNILLVESEDGPRPIIIDFGLVKRAPENLNQTVEQLFKNLSLSNEVKGTPAYMAPEQFDPKGEYGELSPATDVWGLAGTMFFALTGEGPVDTMSANPMAAICISPFPEVRSLRPDCPKNIDKLLQYSFQKRADARPTMRDFADVLAGKKSLGRNWFLPAFACVIFIALALGGGFAFQANLESEQRAEIKEVNEFCNGILVDSENEIADFRESFIQGKKLDKWYSRASKGLLALNDAIKRQKLKATLIREMGEDPTELVRSLRRSHDSLERLIFVDSLNDPTRRDQSIASERCEKMALTPSQDWASYLLLLEYSKALGNSEACVQSYRYFVDKDPAMCRKFPDWLDWHQNRSDWKGYENLLRLLQRASLDEAASAQLLGRRLDFELSCENSNAKQTFLTLLKQPMAAPKRLISGALRLSLITKL